LAPPLSPPFPSWRSGPPPLLVLSRLSLADRPAGEKAIRRSLKGDKEPKPQHISITPKSAIAILPPKKVSRCATPSQLACGLGIVLMRVCGHV